MRNQAILKLHEAKGPRLPYPAQESEIRENEYAYLAADGIAILDGEGILYWVDAVVTTDAGGVTVYDNNAASGKILAGVYEAKAVSTGHKSWDPPKRYEHGLYVNLTTSEVEICYKPIARNLRCKATIFYPPGTSNLVSRVTVVYIAGTRSLVSRVTVAYIEGSSSLVSRVSVVFAEASTNLVSKVTVQLALYRSNLVSRVTVAYAEGTSNLVSRLTVRGTADKALTCRLYADQTP